VKVELWRLKDGRRVCTCCLVFEVPLLLLLKTNLVLAGGYWS